VVIGVVVGVDDGAIGGRPDGHGLLGETVEEHAAGLGVAAIEAEREFVEVVVDSREAKAGIGDYFAFYNVAFIRRTATARRWPSGATARSRPVGMWTTLTR